MWKTIQTVPFGTVASYGQIATLANLPGRARLVGHCISQAPASWALPWHRVLRASGQLAFAEHSKNGVRQRDLLQKEGVEVVNNRVAMRAFQWAPNLEDFFKLTHDSETTFTPL
ncbi:MGMT family protein [Teredinibacter purpureus]|uniref:MGMT family protein n=1 Tax=Teredinibacter purpureus TaxID=2731756 RepID=UPI0038B45BEE